MKLGTGVLILPQRNPVVLAKEVATLDLLSGGRALLGIGVGWLQEEFDAIGVPFDDRDDAPTTTSPRSARCGPSTSPATTVTTARSSGCCRTRSRCEDPCRSWWVGTPTSPPRRAGRLGDGFFPAKSERLAELVDVMRASATKAGRDPDAIEITTGATLDPEERRMMADLGVRRVVIPPPALDADHIDAALERTMDAPRR